MKNIKEYLESDSKSITLYHKKGEIKLSYTELPYGYWSEYTYDKNGNQLTYKDLVGFWSKYTYDKNGNELTYRDSDGDRQGFDIEEMTMEEVCIALGKTIKITK